MLLRTVGLAFVYLAFALAAQADEQIVSFYREVRPIFQQRCQGCHQPARALGGYVITMTAGRNAGGESGERAIVPGDPEASYLVSQITPHDGFAEMPKEDDPLSDAQLALIRRWITQGAHDDSPGKQQPNFNANNPPKYRLPPTITSLDYSPDGSLLAVAGFHEVLLHDPLSPKDGTPIARLIGMSERIESVRFSPDGKLLAVTGGSPARMGEVQIWNVADRSLTLSLPVTFDTVYGASWSPDSKLVAFGCADNTVRVIEAASGKQVLFQSAHTDWVLDAVFSADGSHLASVGRDATAKLIEVPTERFVDNITSITPGALRGGINSVARHPTRDEILFGGADGVPKIYRMHRQTKRVIGDDANLLWKLPALPGRIFGVDYSHQGDVIAAGSSLDGHGAIHIYGIDPAPALPDAIRDILFRPTHARNKQQRDRLQQHFDEGIVTLATISIDTGVYSVAVSPDSNHVAAGSADGRVRIVDAGTGAIVHDFAVAPTSAASGVVTDLEATQPQQPVALPSTSTEPPADSSSPDFVPVKLVALPNRIELRRPTEYSQLVVLAESEQGQTIDMTRDVQLSRNQVVHVSPFGLVTPRANGTTTITASIGGVTVSIPVAVTGMESELHPDYLTDVAPVFARAGCNAGTCHGAQDGKRGFKLSLRGYDPIFDVRSLTDDLGSRRTNLASPADSLFLLKPTGAVPHEGGVVVTETSAHYLTLLAWVRDGARLDLNSARVASIEVQPINPSISEIGAEVQMRVVATYTDGSQRDVTRDSFIESGNTEVVALTGDHPGLVKVLRRGEAPMLVRYEGAYVATTLTAIGDREGFVRATPPANNQIDEFIHAKLARTQTSIAPLCDDYTFLRRVYLDLTGLPPTPEQIESFIEDPRDSHWKREALIDLLVGSAEYVEHWTNKWADLLQVNGKFLGREGATAFRNWIRGHIEANTPYDEFARLILTANGSNKDNPAASYFKILREPEATMENTTQLFLATRFNCNKCHDHPFERWTQDQYYQLSAYFARVHLRPDAQSGEAKIGGTAVEGAKTLYEIVSEKSNGEVKHQRTGEVAAPQFPVEFEHIQDESASRREQLASWIVSKNNPYFAMSYANRVWAYLTGRGLIEPIDDIRAGNPPTNPELLDWLTSQFIESGFDAQHLIRVICKSRTYQLSLATDAFNDDDQLNYSHARARRLPAEVLYDAIYRTVGAKSSFPDLPENLRAAALPDVGIKLPDGFLNNLGRPPRESACECERIDDLQMGPVMALINGATVGEALSQQENAIQQLAHEEVDNRKLIERLFMRILNRPATTVEINDAESLVDCIEQQHTALATELASYEVELQPVLVEREAARVRTLAEKKALLAKHVADHADERRRLAEERVARIETAKADREALRAELIAQFPTWLEKQQAAEWEVLHPHSVTSNIDETFEIQEDSSIFVSGGSGKLGSNTFVAPADLSGITGIRLEAIADERLSKNGPGRSGNGNFVLSEFKAWMGAHSAPRELIRAWDFSSDTNGWQPDAGTTLAQEDGQLVISSNDADVKRLRKPVTVPAGPLQVELSAQLNHPTTIRVLWLHAQSTAYDAAERSVTVATTGTSTRWRTIRLVCQPTEAITELAIEFEGSEQSVQVDAVRLVRTESVKLEPITLTNPRADHNQNGHTVQQSIDGNPNDNRGWAVSPRQGQSHIATFEIAEGPALTGDGLIKVELFHKHNSKDHTLGRFRLSVTRAERPVLLGLPPELVNIANTPAKTRSEEDQANLINFYLDTNDKFQEMEAVVAAAETPVPPDPVEEQLKRRVTELEQPLAPDPKLVRLQRALELSEQQLAKKRLTAAQDIAWALINSPEFLYNH